MRVEGEVGRNSVEFVGIKYLNVIHVWVIELFLYLIKYIAVNKLNFVWKIILKNNQSPQAIAKFQVNNIC